MNICVFTKSLIKGGAEKQSVLLAEILASSNQVTLMVWNGNKKNQFEEKTANSNFRTVFLKGNSIKKMVEFHRNLKQKNITIIFSYLLTTNIVAAIIGKLSNTKYIFGGIRSVYQPFWKMVILKLIHNYITDFTISNSYSSIPISREKGFDPEKIIVIPNGISFNENISPKLIQSETTILTVARFVKEKDYLTAIKAINYLHYHLLNKSEYHIKYIIVGYGELQKEIEKQITLRQLDDVITIVENYNPEELYNKADIYLCTSMFEGISNSILEAMNNALPIIATKAGDNEYLVENAKNGFLCDPKDWRGIANCLYVLIRYPEYRIIMGNESHKIIEYKYSQTIFERNYKNLIRSLEVAKNKNALNNNILPNQILVK